jgi:hypothetical protein
MKYMSRIKRHMFQESLFFSENVKEKLRKFILTLNKTKIHHIFIIYVEKTNLS